MEAKSGTSLIRCAGLVVAIVVPQWVTAQTMKHEGAAHDVPQEFPQVGPIGSDVAPPQEIGRTFLAPPPVPEATAPRWERLRPQGEGIDEPYTLDLLLTLACQNNPTLRQARLHINAELAKAQQAGLYPNPVASYVGEQIGLDNTAGEWHGAEIEQRFVTAGKLDLSRNKYLQRAKVAEHLAVAQQFRVCNDVRVHFFRSLAALQVVDMHRELVKTAEDRVLTVREMYNLGEANRAAAHDANAMLQKHRLQLMKTENDARMHLVELTALVGLELVDPPLAGSLDSDRPPIDFEAAYAQIIQCSPELLAAYAKLREDAITVERESIEWVPDIVVSGGTGYNFSDQQTTGAARVSIEIPLFDRNQGTINQAQTDYARQQSEIRRTRLDLRRRLGIEYEKYLTAYQHVLEYESVILPAKQEAYGILLGSYKANRAEWPDVLRAQEEYTLARIENIMQHASVRVSEALIEGYLLHGGLVTPSGPVPGGHIDSVPKPR